MNTSSKFCFATLTLGVIFRISICQAQKANDRPFGTYSSTTDYYNASAFEKKGAKRMLRIYTLHPDEKLVGNECVSSLTREFGFEYTYPFDVPGEQPNKLKIFFSNMLNTLSITLRNGFGWKKRVNKRIDQCKLSSGERLD